MNRITRFNIAVVKGDGIGPEVIDSAILVLDRLGFRAKYHVAEAGYACYQNHGTPLPDETIEIIKNCDASLFGAVTTPAHIAEYPSAIVQLRQRLNLYANLRPFKTYPGIGRYGDESVHILLFRENTEDLYIGLGWRHEDQAYNLRRISEAASRRILRMAFEHGVENKLSVTVVHKANVIKPSDVLFLETAHKVAVEYPEVKWQAEIVDSLCMKLVLYPDRYQVIVAPNFHGDILSDLLAGVVGSLGLCPSANIGEECSLFEPVHGSAPDIAGQKKANPIGAILSAKLMLEHLGDSELAKRLDQAVSRVIQSAVLTPDLGGTATTQEVTNAVISRLED
ncbi:isocitrate/isopropylmalate dehydrogenase family protein [Candidatus Acetothermia bacterium]|nr:isocitrate/isopropylmalate dehydrogenase family protein [Candidatus Acetothermia bacterium]MBI3643932.1 isocitrate/isopropylmalate dehydrogenase family protein [Candidatus Acetothermia bacterium]